MGANCPLVFGIAIPAFGYISSLRCEDTASIGAEGLFILPFCEPEFISDSNRKERKDLRKVRKVLTV